MTEQNETSDFSIARTVGAVAKTAGSLTVGAARAATHVVVPPPNIAELQARDAAERRDRDFETSRYLALGILKKKTEDGKKPIGDLLGADHTSVFRSVAMIGLLELGYDMPEIESFLSHEDEASLTVPDHGMTSEIVPDPEVAMKEASTHPLVDAMDEFMISH